MINALLLTLLAITVVSFIIGLIVTIREEKNVRNSNVVFTVDKDYSKVYEKVNSKALTLNDNFNNSVVNPTGVNSSSNLDVMPFTNNNSVVVNDTNISNVNPAVVNAPIIEKVDPVVVNNTNTLNVNPAVVNAPIIEKVDPVVVNNTNTLNVNPAVVNAPIIEDVNSVVVNNTNVSMIADNNSSNLNVDEVL